MTKITNKPLMPKGTAIWLIDNTTLTFEQIAEFCGLHILEVQGIADGDVARGMIGENPVRNHQLTKDEIARCERDPDARLNLAEAMKQVIKAQAKTAKKANYIPVARRSDKPDAIAWLLKECPEMSDEQIAKLVSTTKTTIMAVRTKTHYNSPNIKPRSPVLLGLCSKQQFDAVYEVALERHKIAMQKEREKMLERIENLEENAE